MRPSLPGIILPLMLCAVPSAHADLILLRDGSEIECTIRLVSDTDIKYLLPRNDQQMSTPTSDVYMLNFNKRGNVYISPQGKRITGENRPIPKGADIVYLVEGKEIPAFNLNINDEEISFLDQKPSKKSIPVAKVYKRSEVFKIVYRDGSTDVITPFDSSTQNSSTTDGSGAIQPEYKAIIHTVSGKETLASIASRYGVDAEDIMEWNSLDPRLAPTSEITTGRQLMIYVMPATNN